MPSFAALSDTRVGQSLDHRPTAKHEQDVIPHRRHPRPIRGCQHDVQDRRRACIGATHQVLQHREHQESVRPNGCRARQLSPTPLRPLCQNPMETPKLTPMPAGHVSALPSAVPNLGCGAIAWDTACMCSRASRLRKKKIAALPPTSFVSRLRSHLPATEWASEWLQYKKRYQSITHTHTHQRAVWHHTVPCSVV